MICDVLVLFRKGYFDRGNRVQQAIQIRTTSSEIVGVWGPKNRLKQFGFGDGEVIDKKVGVLVLISQENKNGINDRVSKAIKDAGFNIPVTQIDPQFLQLEI